LQFTDSSDVPLNFTNWSGYAQAWNKGRTVKYADFLFTFVNRVEGRIKISLTDTQTEVLPDEIFYDILLEDSSGFRDYYMEGIGYVSEGYTKPVAP
jgi:hypothetical protein